MPSVDSSCTHLVTNIIGDSDYIRGRALGIHIVKYKVEPDGVLVGVSLSLLADSCSHRSGC